VKPSAAILSIAFLVALAAPLFAESSEVDYAVAYVNSEKITKSMVDRRLAAMTSRAQATAASPTFAEALDVEIQRALILQAAEKQLDQDVKDRVRQMAKTYAAREEDPKVFKRAPDDKTVDLYYQDLLLQAFLQRKLDRFWPTPAEVKEYYDSHPERFAEPPTVIIREILIRLEGRSAEDAKALIDKAAARLAATSLAAGEDFAAVAKEMSESPYAPSGGLWPSKGRGELIPEVESVAFSAHPGEVSAPFKSAIGWHIIKVEEVSDKGLKSYANVQQEIYTELRNVQRARAQNQLVKDLKATAIIKIVGT
jgi:parvulin-like peptidyl-prolyl isomerase